MRRAHPGLALLLLFAFLGIPTLVVAQLSSCGMGGCEYPSGEDPSTCALDCPAGTAGDTFVLQDLAVEQPHYHDAAGIPIGDLVARVRVRKKDPTIQSFDIVLSVRDEGGVVTSLTPVGGSPSSTWGCDFPSMGGGGFESEVECAIPIELVSSPYLQAGPTYILSARIRPHFAGGIFTESILSNNVASQAFLVLKQNPDYSITAVPDTPFWMPLMVGMIILSILYFSHSSQRKKK